MFACATLQAQNAAPAVASPAGPAVVRDDQIGVCTHFAFKGNGWPTDKMVPLIAQSGAGWIRDDFIWSAIEKSPGVYAIPPETMNWINAVSAAGIKIDITFNYGNKIYPDHYDPAAFAAAAAWTAKTLAGKIQAMEIMNEPENFGFSKYYDKEQAWSGLLKDGSVATYISKYVNLLNTAAKAIRAANPDIKIIGLGMAPAPNFRALAMGIDPTVDGITDHPYSFGSEPEFVPYRATPGTLKRDGLYTADDKGTFASQIKMYQEQSAKYNGPKEIWLTEQGWPTYHPTKPTIYLGFSEEAQAKYILRRLTEALGLGVAAGFIYDLRDDSVSPTSNEAHYGLLDKNSNPKPSYVALQHYTAAMADFRPKTNFDITATPEVGSPDAAPADVTNATPAPGATPEPPPEVKTYQFADSKGTPLIALWSAQPVDGKHGPLTADVQIQSARPIAKISAYDPFGNTTQDVPFAAAAGGVTLPKMTVPDSPLLLTVTLGPIQQAQANP